MLISASPHTTPVFELELVMELVRASECGCPVILRFLFVMFCNRIYRYNLKLELAHERYNSRRFCSRSILLTKETRDYQTSNTNPMDFKIQQAGLRRKLPEVTTPAPDCSVVGGDYECVSGWDSVPLTRPVSVGTKCVRNLATERITMMLKTPTNPSPLPQSTHKVRGKTALLLELLLL